MTPAPDSRPPEFTRVLEAMHAGDDFGDGLQLEDLRRAEAVTVDARGDITFVVERHPHLMGHPSNGQPSSAFRRLRNRYRLPRGGRGLLDDSEHLENVIHYELLAEELVTPPAEALIDEMREASTDPEAASRLAASIEWIPTALHDEFTPGELSRIIEACNGLMVRRILEAAED